LKLVQGVRDETHRFAITFHRGRREKRSFSSLLDGIPGVGPKKRSTLLARYGSLEAIRTAPREELDKLVGSTAAAKVLDRLDSDQSSRGKSGPDGP
jgi:excinuclease ABC subunit C